MMSLDDLKRVLPPPEEPRDNRVDWQGIYETYGVDVPDDFRELVSLYGSGVIDGFLWLLNPGASNKNVGFEKAAYFVESYQTMKEEFPEDYPRPHFPENGSFFPWAVTDNGETLVWIVDGPSNSWCVAVHSVDQGEEEVYSEGAVAFLVKLLNKEIRSNLVPSQFPSDTLRFEAV